MPITKVLGKVAISERSHKDQGPRTIRDRLSQLFPGDPLLAELEMACKLKPEALAVYLKCRRWRLTWQHPAGNSKHLRAYLRNPVWPARALALCLKYGVPAPTWVMQWTNELTNGRASIPTDKNRNTAKSVDKATNEIADALYTTPSPDVVVLDQAASLNSADARRLRKALLEINDSLGFPRALNRKRTSKPGKK